jgi:hypothetical protein
MQKRFLSEATHGSLLMNS